MQPHPLAKKNFFLAKFIELGQIWLDIGKIWANLMRYGQNQNLASPKTFGAIL